MTTKAELEAENAELKEQLQGQGDSSGSSTDDRTVVQRILAIANEVRVLEAERTGGVPFAFRGVDATVAHLSPLMNKHGVFPLPVDVNHILTQRDTSGGKVVTKAEVEVTYRFYGAKGDYVDAKIPGQADDFADRSTAQAMSVAFRILLLQMFHIPAFGKEPEQSGQEVQDGRAAAANAKIEGARQSAPAEAPKPNRGAESVRAQIVQEAGQRGMEPSQINSFAEEVTGLKTDDWWDDVAKLNDILKAIKAKEVE